MPKFKSPGQKRKGIVRIVAILMFAALTYGGSLVVKYYNAATLNWTENHQVVTATVSDLTQHQEEYRNLKGRVRHRNTYQVSYEFVVNGEAYGNTVEVDHALYSRLGVGEEMEVWFASDEPTVNDIGDNVRSALAADNPIGNMIDVAPYTVPTSLFIYWMLALIFVRESKKAMPEGFYTETSWLDVDDQYIVALDHSDLIYFKFGKNRTDAAQEAYQNDEPLEALIRAARPAEVIRIPLGEVNRISSDHNSDTIEITHDRKNHSIEFLNQAVKAHALDRIKGLFPEELSYVRKDRTRLQAALPSMLLLLALAAGAYYLDVLIAHLIIGYFAVFSIGPRFVSGLLDPTVTETWELGAEPQPESAA